MKQNLRIIVVFGVLTAFGVASWCAYRYWYAYKNKYPPFATGTDKKVFLGATTFEMSPQEVERAMGHPLMPFEEYVDSVNHQKSEPHLGLAGEYNGGPEQEKRYEILHSPNIFPTRLYMTNITMLDTPCAGRFTFINKRLFDVELQFTVEQEITDNPEFPIDEAQAKSLIDRLDNAMQRLYRLEKKKKTLEQQTTESLLLTYQNDYAFHYPRLVDLYKDKGYSEPRSTFYPRPFPFR